jgi:hypothetical protein
LSSPSLVGQELQQAQEQLRDRDEKTERLRGGLDKEEGKLVTELRQRLAKVCPLSYRCRAICMQN